MGKLQKQETLIIDKPSINVNGIAGTIEDILHKIEKEGYDLTITEMASILDCSIQFISLNLVSHIPNIILNSKIKMLLRKTCKELPDILNSSSIYLFSRTGFYEYVKQNMKATRNSHIITLSKRNELKLLQFREEKENEEKIKRKIGVGKNLPKLARNRIHVECLKEILEKLGYTKIDLLLGIDINSPNISMKRIITSTTALRRFDYEDYDLDAKVPKAFCSLKKVRGNLGYTSDEVTYRDIFLKGLIKYELFDGKLVRYDKIEVKSARRGSVILTDEQYKEWKETTGSKIEF